MNTKNEKSVGQTRENEKSQGVAAVAAGSACAWQPIESAPKDDGEIIILFDSATVNVVRLCWWDNGAPRPWDDDKPRPDDVGWWSYKHSVTQEQIDLMTPVAWMPMPPWPNDKDEPRA